MGISLVRVTQLFRILKLAQEFQEVIAALGDPLPSPTVTERKLRSLINLPAKDQLEKVLARLATPPLL